MFTVMHRPNRKTDAISRCGAVDDLCAGFLRKLQMAREEVRMKVRLEHRLDRQAHLTSVCKVLLDIA